MSSAAKSLYVFGIYMIVCGTSFTLLPNVMLRFAGFPPEHDLMHQPWTQVCGAIIAILGCYYLVAAFYELVPFMWATIYGRAAVMATYILLVAMEHVEWRLIVFAVPDQFGALWTFLALRGERKKL